MNHSLAPSKAYMAVSIASLLVGVASYSIGLLNAELQLNEKGYYFVVLLFGLFSVITLQKSIRDEAEGQKVTAAYKYLNMLCVVTACLLSFVGLYNADTLLLNEKGFFGIAFVLSLFASVVVQKNTRDIVHFKEG